MLRFLGLQALRPRSLAAVQADGVRGSLDALASFLSAPGARPSSVNTEPFEASPVSAVFSRVVESASKAVGEAVLFKTPISPELSQIGTHLREAGRLLSEACSVLEDHPTDAEERLVRVKVAANLAHALLRKEFPAVLERTTPESLKLRALHQALSETAAGLDEAADAVGDLLMKRL